MVCGLQGSGKTTFCGKLARRFLKKGKRVLLVAADTQRPAAMDQLEVVGKSVGAEAFVRRGQDPVSICRDGVEEARSRDFDLVVLDTAGRLHVDDDLMEELERIKASVEPHETLLVLDGLTGQDAVNLAEVFSGRIAFSGVVLTKMDGDARGGAALSVTHVTGVPVKFVGTGEKPEALEDFHPDRMASRILGMGDVLTLVERAQEAVDEKQAVQMAEKLRKEQFTLEDFLDQLEQVKKMGPLEDILKMIPGVGKQLKGMTVDDKALVRIQALIQSMTPEERRNPNVIDGSRRKRIARGSGGSVQEVNRLLKQFRDMQKMMKLMKNRRGMGRLPLLLLRTRFKSRRRTVLKIRLKRAGGRNHPFYRVVVVDSRKARDKPGTGRDRLLQSLGAAPRGQRGPGTGDLLDRARRPGLGFGQDPASPRERGASHTESPGDL